MRMIMREVKGEMNPKKKKRKNRAVRLNEAIGPEAE